jgi:hypothetical protein
MSPAFLPMGGAKGRRMNDDAEIIAEPQVGTSGSFAFGQMHDLTHAGDGLTDPSTRRQLFEGPTGVASTRRRPRTGFVRLRRYPWPAPARRDESSGCRCGGQPAVRRSGMTMSTEAGRRSSRRGSGAGW